MLLPGAKKKEWSPKKNFQKKKIEDELNTKKEENNRRKKRDNLTKENKENHSNDI